MTDALQGADRKWLRQAVKLGDRGRFGVSPNPLVGCLLVYDDRIIGEGWHRRHGGPHAEALALEDCARRCGNRAAELLPQTTAYTSLEPCAHHGKTPPCAEALIAAGVRRVVSALPDPNPQVYRRGIARLQQANIEVSCGQHAQIRRLAALANAGYLSQQLRSRPWLVLKLAASMDGRVALHSGLSQWITGKRARADVQQERAAADAIITGIGTVLSDNPRLLPRTDRMTGKKRRDLEASGTGAKTPLRLVLDSKGRMPADAAMLSLAGPVVIAHADTAPAASRLAGLPNCEPLPLPTAANGRIALPGLMAALHRRNCNRALIECGPTLAGALLTAGLVDEILLYQSGMLLGSDSLPLWHLAGPAQVPAAEFELVAHKKLGGDIRLRWIRAAALRQLLAGCR